MKYHNNSVEGTLARQIYYNNGAQKTINQQKIVQEGMKGTRIEAILLPYYSP